MAEKISIKHIVIACCTFKRLKQLDGLLKNLAEINYPQNIKTEILIVDNDKEKSAEHVVKKYNNILLLNYIVEENKGLANVRNKALTTAIELGASHIAFIDDDEVADVNWLINHVEFYNKFEDIYISSGPNYQRFEGNYPDYIINNRIFKKLRKKKLNKIKKTCGSGNVFFPLNIVRENNIYFSPEFNKSGGEDTDFFGRLSNAGYKIGWNYNAVNYEIVDHTRANLKWILKRAYNTGRINGYIKFKDEKNSLKKLFYITKTFVLIIGELFISPIFFINGLTGFINRITKVVHNFGKIVGVIFMRLTQYYSSK